MELTIEQIKTAILVMERYNHLGHNQTGVVEFLQFDLDVMEEEEEHNEV